LTPNDRRDPWGFAYTLFIPGTNSTGAAKVLSFSDANPGYVVSAGQEEGTIETVFATNTVTPAPTTDVLRKIVIR